MLICGIIQPKAGSVHLSVLSCIIKRWVLFRGKLYGPCVCVTVLLWGYRGFPQAFPAQFKFTSEMKHVASDVIIFRGAAFAVSHHSCLKTMQQLRRGIWSVWISISDSIISPHFFVMISYRRSRIAIPGFLPVSVFSICLWVRLSNESHSLSLYLSPSTLPALLTSPLLLPLSSPSLTASFCDCSACPLGLEQTLPLLQERKLI